jgi:hypothetical protein
MRRLVALALVVSAVLVGSASAGSKAAVQKAAFTRARACLMAHGASRVWWQNGVGVHQSTPDWANGTGYVQFPSIFDPSDNHRYSHWWQYLTEPTSLTATHPNYRIDVVSATVYDMKSAMRHVVKACLSVRGAQYSVWSMPAVGA